MVAFDILSNSVYIRCIGIRINLLHSDLCAYGFSIQIVGGENVKFYCKECNKILSRRYVASRYYEDGYTCNWCGSTVYSCDRLLADLFKDYIEYLEKKGSDLSDYE